MISQAFLLSLFHPLTARGRVRKKVEVSGRGFGKALFHRDDFVKDGRRSKSARENYWRDEFSRHL
jgi:hypothetical protein